MKNNKKKEKEDKEKNVDLGNVFDRIFKENGERMFTKPIHKSVAIVIKIA